MKKVTLVLSILFLTVSIAFAGGAKIKVVSGDIKVLKGEKEVKLQYEFKNVAVGKYKNEEDYIKKRKEEGNAKEPGKGDKWEKNWRSDRENRYQQHFEDKINEVKKDINFSRTAGGKYTMVIKTTFIEPGYNVYVSRKPAMVNLAIDILDANGKAVCKLTITGAPGTSWGFDDFDTGVRISEAYEKAGKDFGKFLNKMLK